MKKITQKIKDKIKGGPRIVDLTIKVSEAEMFGKAIPTVFGGYNRTMASNLIWTTTSEIEEQEFQKKKEEVEKLHNDLSAELKINNVVEKKKVKI